MQNPTIMTAQWEKEKNLKASGITLGAALLLLLIFWMVNVSMPDAGSTQTVQEYIEVNLGSSDVGSGSDQPMLPGDPAPAEEPAYTPPADNAQPEESKEVETDDRNEPDAPAVRSTPTTRPATRIATPSTPAPRTPAPTTTATPAPPRPRATMGRTTGGTGTGGNGADTYRPGTGEGPGNGTGDAGRPGGSPTGGSYTGPKNFGTRSISVPPQSFEDDFNENGKVAMDVVADANGKVTSASYQPKGSTTSTRGLVEIARRTALKTRCEPSPNGSKGTLVFVFRVN